MRNLTQASLILGATLRTRWRALGEHWFTAAVIGPMIVGGFYYILEPSAMRAAEAVRTAAQGWRGGDSLAAGMALAIALTVAGAPAAMRAAYAIRSPDSSLDALPVSAGVRFQPVFVFQVVWNVPFWIVVWLGFEFLSGAANGAALALGPALAALAGTAALQLVMVLTAVRFGLLGRGRLLLLTAALGAVTVAAGFEPLWALAAGPLALPAAFWSDSLARATGGSAAAWSGAASLGAQALAAAVFYGLALAAYVRWRDDDREAAERASVRRGGLLAGFAKFSARRFGRRIGTQVTRDLRLTLRGFSPAVYVAVAGAVLFQLAAFEAIRSDWLAGEWPRLFCAVLLRDEQSVLERAGAAAAQQPGPADVGGEELGGSAGDALEDEEPLCGDRFLAGLPLCRGASVLRGGFRRRRVWVDLPGVSGVDHGSDGDRLAGVRDRAEPGAGSAPGRIVQHRTERDVRAPGLLADRPVFVRLRNAWAV